MLFRSLIIERGKGAAILLISADLEEILALSDTIAVMYDGKIMGLFENSENPDLTAIGLMMAGKK